jgi:ribose 5-phosphate isomerase A
MIIGLGTGSTSSFFIHHLINRCHEGLKIKVVATSSKSEHQAKLGGIPFADIDAITTLDLAFDGADEIDKKNNMIKGGGGALLREKIIANMAKQFIVMVDESKCVDAIGHFPLPVEIASFAHLATFEKIKALGFRPIMRICPMQSLFLTDNGNFIADLHFDGPIHNPHEVHLLLKAIPGVVETGLFLDFHPKVVIGYKNGTVKLG